MIDRERARPGDVTARKSPICAIVDWDDPVDQFRHDIHAEHLCRRAAHAWLATLSDPDASAAEEGEILRAVTNAFPTVTSVRVKDAIDMVNRIVGQLATAIRAAAAVALIASVLVLAGALAAGNRARAHDAVILKTLGATRRTLIRAFSYEYMILGVATAVFALFAGGVAAWFVVSQIMTLPFAFPAGCGDDDGCGGPVGDRWDRHGRNMAGSRPKGGAGVAQSLIFPPNVFRAAISAAESDKSCRKSAVWVLSRAV